jgi:hypothetical protein
LQASLSDASALAGVKYAPGGQFIPNGVRGVLRVRSVVRALGGGRVIDRCHAGAVGFGASL